MFSFGFKLLITNLLGTIYDNLYTLVIGKRFTATDLGYYSKSDHLVRFPTNNMAFIMSRVSYPTLVNLKDDDIKLAGAYRKFLIVSSFLIFPLMIGFAVLAKPFIIVLFTEKWAAMALILQLLCIDWMWDPMCKINTNILLVKGKSGLILRLEIIKRIISVAILFASLPFGLIPVCIGRIIYSLISVFINSFYTGRMLPELTFYRQMIIISPYVLVSLIMGGIVYCVQFFISSLLLQLIIGTLVGIIVYYLLAKLFHLEALNETIIIIKSKLCKQ
jgi:O-antigen/teichoic acid export membrane protein